MSASLAERVIAVPEARAADVLSRMLEERGARTLRVPLIDIKDSPDRDTVEGWITRATGGQWDDLILYTGEGLRRLLGFAERMGCKEAFIASLARVRKITRGPKPVRALREIGLDADLRTEDPTTAGLVHVLETLDLTGHTVGLQLYPNPRVEALLAALRQADARVDPVLPYVYVPAAEAQDVVHLIEQLAAGNVDGIAFTSAAQVARLADVATAFQRVEMLARGLDRCLVAAIGPVVQQALQHHSRQPDVVAAEPYALKPLVRAMENWFSAKGDLPSL